MITRILDVSDYQKELNILERVHFEVRARENIITFLLQKNQGDTPAYKKYYEEYIQYLKAHDIVKKEFGDKCINQILGYEYTNSWTVKYDEKEVIIYE